MRLSKMRSNAEYYRIIDADYAFIGLKTTMVSVAKSAIDSLRRDGLRVGAVLLDEPSPLSIELANLLAQVLALGVVESRTSKDQIAPEIMSLLWKASARPEWYCPGRIPRVYSAVMDAEEVTPREEHLIGLAKAMQTYEPEQVLFTTDGSAKPVGRISRARAFAEVA